MIIIMLVIGSGFQLKSQYFILTDSFWTVLKQNKFISVNLIFFTVKLYRYD